MKEKKQRIHDQLPQNELTGQNKHVKRQKYEIQQSKNTTETSKNSGSTQDTKENIKKKAEDKDNREEKQK